MFSKILDEDTILVAYSNASLGANTTQIRALDQAAVDYASTPHPKGGRWRIVRIPMVIDNRNDIFYAYTNSIIVNNSVIVPNYGFTTDSDALEVYRSAMPGYRVVGVDSYSVIPMGGSVHCTTMQVPVDREASGPVCGDGRVTGSEVCDDSVVAWAALDEAYTGGTATCNSRCSGWNVSSCTTSGPSDEVTINSSGSLSSDDYDIIGGGWIEAGVGSFIAEMTGTGDADLYVWHNVESPTWGNYTCRPYNDNSNETCNLSGPGSFLVAVSGYTASTYNIVITYSP